MVGASKLLSNPPKNNDNDDDNNNIPFIVDRCPFFGVVHGRRLIQPSPSSLQPASSSSPPPPSGALHLLLSLLECGGNSSSSSSGGGDERLRLRGEGTTPHLSCTAAFFQHVCLAGLLGEIGGVGRKLWRTSRVDRSDPTEQTDAIVGGLVGCRAALLCSVVALLKRAAPPSNTYLHPCPPCVRVSQQVAKPATSQQDSK